ncbi:unnamed protein product, partial [Linum tenue]
TDDDDRLPCSTNTEEVIEQKPTWEIECCGKWREESLEEQEGWMRIQYLKSEFRGQVDGVMMIGCCTMEEEEKERDSLQAKQRGNCKSRIMFGDLVFQCGGGEERNGNGEWGRARLEHGGEIIVGKGKACRD